MKLHRGDQDDWTYADWLVELQQRVGKRFEVFPVDSSRAYEEFECEDQLTRVVHKTFCVQVKELSAIEAAKAVEMIWRDICETFAEGSMVMWRVRPTAQTSDAVCECCGSPTKQHTIRLRIGGDAANESISPPTLVIEGALKIPYARSV